MNRFRISSILFILALLISAFTSCAKQEAPQSDPAPETDQTQTDPQPIEQTPSEIVFPYSFDTEQPSEIDPSIFAHNPGVFGNPVFRIEFDPEISSKSFFPDQLPIYQTEVYSPAPQDYTSSQIEAAQEHLEHYLSCYTGPGVVESVNRGRLICQKIDQIEATARPYEISISGIPMLCNTAQNWEHPSKEDILYEIEHNEYVKAACKYLEITDPEIVMETIVFESQDGGKIYNWDARVFQKSDDLLESAFNKSCKSVSLHGENPFYGKKEDHFGLTLQTISPIIAEESVPVISVEDALKEVLDGKYVKTGMLFTNNGIADLTEEALVSVRLKFKNEGVVGIKSTGLYVPFYEFIFNCTDNEGDYVSQTMLVLPACNLYLKPAE